ncbi:hypothetical protein SAMN04488033_12563 [Salegentibacter agarivorans]|uniref:Uncharacterized protein n=1 Tax=Salegentibacter agarivorans TaxID=345907 RepID=A0A1I2NXK3_9FLAO|nr:hypothetical protein [Salegentibacter agarivorans]SFG08408.1 hypothetical protein SAMN04488033_12563 [Salegentibacter agarivorans]
MKKLILKLFPLFIVTLFISNCGQKREQSQANFGEVVFYEVFPKILDSIYSDHRIIPPPPPPEYFKFMDSSVNIEEGFEEWQKTDHFEKWLANWEKTKDSIARDTTTIYLVVPDSVSIKSNEDRTEFLNYIGLHENPTDSLIISNSFKLKLSKLKSNQKKIKFLYRSEFPEGREFWRTDYDIYIAASLGFSKIIFDKTKRFGVVNAGFVMGPLNGYGKRIFIRKDKNGNWVVDKVESTWIS